MTQTPCVKLVADGVPSTTLSLYREPPTQASAVTEIDAEKTYRFELHGFEEEKLTATVYLNEEAVPAMPVRRDDGVIVLYPSSEEKIFANFFGLIRLSFFLSGAGGKRHTLYAPLFLVDLPEGRATDNLKAMETVIGERWTQLVGSGGELLVDHREKIDPLATRERLYDEILRIYESQFSYFRSNARFRLKTESTVDGTAKLRHFSAETARFIASHPEELVEAPNGTGIRLGTRNFLPLHTLVRRNVRDYETVENQVLIGFLLTVLKGIEADQAAVADLLVRSGSSTTETNGLTGGQALLAMATERLRQFRSRLHAIEDRVRETIVHYRSALGLVGRPVLCIPEPTPVFRSIPPYRVIFDAVVTWFRAGKLVLETEEALIASMHQSLLYEYFVLVKLIDGLLDADCRFIERRRLHWSGSSVLDHVRTDHANAFIFESEGRRITLYYQPVIGSNPSGENGLALMRRSSWSLTETELRASNTLVYTPDFLIQVEKEDRTHCFILDAKFSSLHTVRLHYAASLVFRYLFSIGPCKPRSRVEGLWLFCGNALHDQEPDQALLADIPSPFETDPMPNVHLGKFDGLQKEATQATIDSLLSKILSF